MEAFIREANTLLAMLAEEFGTSPGASKAKLRFILGIVEPVRQAAASDTLPLWSARPVASLWTFRALPRERLLGVAQWFCRPGVLRAA